MTGQKRTEEQIVTSANITAILGGMPYEIKPLVIRDSRGWRAEVIGLIAKLPGEINKTTDNPADFESSFNKLLVTMPDQVIDLFFAYAKDLDRDEIESVATDVELASAFEKIVEVAFPLTQSLPKTMGRLSR